MGQQSDGITKVDEIMTEQEIFNQVATHLLTQMRTAQSVEQPAGGCRYRVETQGRVLKCAVGCLIPDESYTPDLEGVAVFYLGWNRATCKLKVDGFSSYGVDRVKYKSLMLMGSLLTSLGLAEHVDLLIKLQGIHDRILTSEWKSALQLLAKERSLTMPEVVS